MIRFEFDPANLPHVSEADQIRSDALTDEEITAGAEADPDNPPLTEAELQRLDMRRLARRARERTGLSQAKFAGAFRINLSRLRDLEQGRYTAHDSALSAYLAVIAQEPDLVKKALATEL